MVKILALFVSAIFLSSCLNDRQVDQPTVPEYKDWDVTAREISCSLDNETISLWANLYENSGDGYRGTSQIMELMKGGESWLLIHFFDVMNDRGVSVKSYQLFEYRAGSWSFVRDFTVNDIVSLEREISDFMLSKYKLICKA